MADLAGKHIVVTGGLGGLGTGVVKTLAELGAEIHIPALESEPGDSDYHVTAGVDLTQEAAVGAYFQSLPALWASVHCAGGFAMGPIGETSLDTVRSQIDINFITCFLCCREATSAIRRSGEGGRIVNVASRPALSPVAQMSAYVAAKAAVSAFTQSIAAELHAESILVNAVVPSIIDTPTNRKAMPDADHDSWPKPAAIGVAIAHLVSPRNTLTHGALVPVYGAA